MGGSWVIELALLGALRACCFQFLALTSTQILSNFSRLQVQMSSSKILLRWYDFDNQYKIPSFDPWKLPQNLIKSLAPLCFVTSVSASGMRLKKPLIFWGPILHPNPIQQQRQGLARSFQTSNLINISISIIIDTSLIWKLSMILLTKIGWCLSHQSLNPHHPARNSYILTPKTYFYILHIF